MQPRSSVPGMSDVIHAVLSARKIIVFDIEFTSWPGAKERDWTGPGEHREVVQIGAALVDEELKEVASFSQLVRPTVNPVLSDYFVALTGITNDDVGAHGRPLKEGLNLFAAFCTPADVCCSFGRDNDVIQESCDLIGIENPARDFPFMDVRPWLCDLANVQPSQVNSSSIPDYFGIERQAHAHDGLSDARAVVTVLRHIKKLDPAGLIYR